MSTKLKMLPAFVMLFAGAATSIITFVVHYEMKTALLILLAVLIVFYIFGLILQKLLVSFEQANEATEDEGTVVEKGEEEVKRDLSETAKNDK